MSIEGDDEQGQRSSAGLSFGFRDHRLMPEMDTVEGADAHDGAAPLRVQQIGPEVHLHSDESGYRLLLIASAQRSECG